jgi:hypothetical protein
MIAPADRKELRRNMALGDHIKTRRAGGLYTHHGIDMGDGTVVHFSGDPVNFRDASVCRVAMEEFLQGGRLILVAHREPVLSGEETARIAESLIGARGYHPLINNCEHFTTYCKTGRKDSAQARRFVKAAITAGFTALAVGAHVARRARGRNGQRAAETLAQALQQLKKRQEQT